jgi:hypothetical protein
LDDLRGCIEKLRARSAQMKRMEIVIVLALASLAPAVAQAGHPSVFLSFSGGHYGHCHHHYARPYFYAYAPPPPVYVYPPPAVSYVAPTYVAPPAAAAPNWTSRSEPRSNVLPASQTTMSAVTIRNPAASGGTVTFVVDTSDEVTLTAGQTQTLNTKNGYTVEFDRGGDFGVTRKTLSSGAYEFQVTDRGWDLVEASRVATRATVRRNELPDSKLR